MLSPDSDIPDELLYGRAGYLYALLYVNKEIGPDTVDETTIAKVTDNQNSFMHKRGVLIKMHHKMSLECI